MALEELDGRQYQATVAALTAAFGTYPKLKAMMRGIDRQISQYATDGPMPLVLDSVLEAAQEQGWLYSLLQGALNANPNNPRLKELAPLLLLSTSGTPPEELQGIVLGNNALQDVEVWRAGMARIEDYVVRFRVNNINDNNAPFGIGSGFLVADDVVLTNCHVVNDLLQPAAATPAVQFGFRKVAGGETASDEIIELSGGRSDWVIGESPEAELDYALVRLPKGTGRPVMPTPLPYVFTAGDIYFILQHPKGAPMKIGAGTLVGTTQGPARVNYTTNSEKGSSGSPVFTLGWQPVALHRSGTLGYNSGVPLSVIYDHAMAAGTWPGSGPKGTATA